MISIRRIALVVLALTLAAGVVTEPAAAKADPAAAASKKCKKKKGAKSAKKRKKCKKGSSSPGSESTLPGQPSHPTATPTATPPQGSGSVAPLTVADLSLSDNPVLGGTGTQGTVTLDAAAPSGGQPVTLASSAPSRVSVPASVHVADGQTSASFPVSTTTGPTATATISASIGLSSQDTSLTVVSDPSVTSLSLAYQCFPGIGLVNVGGNRVNLDVPVPSDTDVSLQSSAPTDLAVPSTVTVPTGASSALFGVDTLLANPSVTVTATLGTSSAQDIASVRDALSPAPAITGLSLSPTLVFAGGTSTGTVTLDCEALAGGVVIDLSTDNPTDVTFPGGPTVTVQQDQLTATFQVATSGAAANGTAAIIGTDPQAGFRQATLTISDLGT